VMDSHMAKVPAETRLHKCARRRIQWLPR
jgi:hypothetical protein